MTYTFTDIQSIWRRDHRLFYLYATYNHIQDRCFNPKHEAYLKYNTVGLYQEWVDDRAKFILYVLNVLGERPSNEYTLDRIDNQKGYEPDNLRWATKSEQAYNRNMKLPSSGERYITKSERPGRQTRYIVYYHRTKTLKSFTSLQAAINFRDQLIKHDQTMA